MSLFRHLFPKPGPESTEKRFIAAINMSIWRDTIETLEYRHDINYPVGAFAAGLGANGLLTPVITTNVDGETLLGHSSDMVTAQIAVYF